jgi:hypothetical protein
MDDLLLPFEPPVIPNEVVAKSLFSRVLPFTPQQIECLDFALPVPIMPEPTNASFMEEEPTSSSLQPVEAMESSKKRRRRVLELDTDIFDFSTVQIPTGFKEIKPFVIQKREHRFKLEIEKKARSNIQEHSLIEDMLAKHDSFTFQNFTFVDNYPKDMIYSNYDWNIEIYTLRNLYNYSVLEFEDSKYFSEEHSVEIPNKKRKTSTHTWEEIENFDFDIETLGKNLFLSFFLITNS